MRKEAKCLSHEWKTIYFQHGRVTRKEKCCVNCAASQSWSDKDSIWSWDIFPI